MTIRNVYLDCEFIPSDPSIAGLISIGLTDGQGRDYYAVNSYLDASTVTSHPWLSRNVWPYLPNCAADFGLPGWLDIRHPDVKTPKQIKADLTRYFGDHGPAHLYAWYGGQDINRLHSLWDNDWSAMPEDIPRWFHEIQSLAYLAGDPQLPQQDGGEHHALADAKYNRQLHQFLTQRAGPHACPTCTGTGGDHQIGCTEGES
ncbi:hypothetical protein [Kitasatospora sp. NBC_01302]|uniref:hypothetical protein n=1 Tax=Kitasatospora sp. NBC_01302 TaxID=2903575 RepID=UPI002E113E9C|nr:3'-5' exoribonuclease [Kitasatospora sp. NBC_01302]